MGADRRPKSSSNTKAPRLRMTLKLMSPSASLQQVPATCRKAGSQQKSMVRSKPHLRQRRHHGSELQAMGNRAVTGRTGTVLRFTMKDGEAVKAEVIG
ncbi:hypothetical protein CLAIMM_13068 [Cladophialophora immunda]|nr:hypothetical protein CLAIMM_13068 [Cladophialophora immunda]